MRHCRRLRRGEVFSSRANFNALRFTAVTMPQPSVGLRASAHRLSQELHPSASKNLAKMCSVVTPLRPRVLTISQLRVRYGSRSNATPAPVGTRGVHG